MTLEARVRNYASVRRHREIVPVRVTATRSRLMAWKSFKFFEKEVLKDPETQQPFERLKVPFRIASTCPFCMGAEMKQATMLHCMCFLNVLIMGIT